MTAIWNDFLGNALNKVGVIRAGLVCGLLLLAGCGGRGSLALLPQDVPAGTVETVLVASSRQTDTAGQVFTRDRAAAPSFMEFDVSVPPDRTPGSIRYPGRNGPDPATDFLVTEVRTLAGPAAFSAAVSGQMDRPGSRDSDAVIFVHGFNTNFAEGLMRQVQLQHDMGRGGASVHFSWPSAAQTLNYVYDRESALHSREALATTLDALAASEARSINLFAHSMGAFLSMDTLWVMAQSGHDAFFDRLDALVLVSPDIEVDVFKRQAPAVLARGVPIYIVVSRGDRALRASALLRGEQDRLGSVHSKDELGGLDVTVIDLSQVTGGDALGHFKVTSPAVAAYVQALHTGGATAFGGAGSQAAITGDAVITETDGVIRAVQ